MRRETLRDASNQRDKDGVTEPDNPVENHIANAIPDGERDGSDASPCPIYTHDHVSESSGDAVANTVRIMTTSRKMRVFAEEDDSGHAQTGADDHDEEIDGEKEKINESNGEEQTSIWY